MPAITIARRRRQALRRAGHRRRSRRVHRPGPRQGRARRQGRRQARRHVVRRSTTTPTLAIVTDKDAEGLDVIRHSTAHLLAYAVKELFPDAQVTIGPVIEDGFYYDFAYKRPFTPEDLAAIETAHGASSRSKDEPVDALGDAARRRGRSSSRAWASTTRRRSSRRSRRDEPISLYARRQLHRPVPRPARAVDRQAQGVQADEGRRRVLARRLEERDAAADLRHGVGEEGGPGRLPAPHRGSGEARPPQARHAARPLPPAGRGAGHGVLASEGLVDLAAGRAVHARASTATTATRKCAARRSSTARCGSARATGRTTRTTCSRRSRRSATSRSSR